MRGNRPAGCVIMDVEVVALDPCRGPGTPGACPRAAVFQPLTSSEPLKLSSEAAHHRVLDCFRVDLELTDFNSSILRRMKGPPVGAMSWNGLSCWSRP